MNTSSSSSTPPADQIIANVAKMVGEIEAKGPLLYGVACSEAAYADLLRRCPEWLGAPVVIDDGMLLDPTKYYAFYDRDLFDAYCCGLRHRAEAAAQRLRESLAAAKAERGRLERRRNLVLAIVIAAAAMGASWLTARATVHLLGNEGIAGPAGAALSLLVMGGTVYGLVRGVRRFRSTAAWVNTEALW